MDGKAVRVCVESSVCGVAEEGVSSCHRRQTMGRREWRRGAARVNNGEAQLVWFSTQPLRRRSCFRLHMHPTFTAKEPLFQAPMLIQMLQYTHRMSTIFSHSEHPIPEEVLTGLSMLFEK